MTAHHEDDVIGKAYDARLMRRLLAYLRPYRRQVALAIGRSSATRRCSWCRRSSPRR